MYYHKLLIKGKNKLGIRWMVVYLPILVWNAVKSLFPGSYGKLSKFT